MTNDGNPADVSPPISFARGILVNRRGQRYINEDGYYGRTGSETLRQPNADAFLLVDDEIYVESAMRRRKRGSLRSSRSGKRVTSRKQAIAIGLSEARKKGAKVPARRRRGGKKR